MQLVMCPRKNFFHRRGVWGVNTIPVLLTTILREKVTSEEPSERLTELEKQIIFGFEGQIGWF